MEAAAPLVVFAAGGAVLIGGIAWMQHRTRSRLDLSRQTFELVLPGDTTLKSLEDFFRSLQGLPNGQVFSPASAVCLEAYGVHGSIRYFLSVPAHEVVDVKSLVRAHLPGARVGPTTDDPSRVSWQVGLELSTASLISPLNVISPEGTTRSMLAAFSSLREGEELLTQWLFLPGSPPGPGNPDLDVPLRKPDVVTLRCTIRVAANGAKPRHLVNQVYAACKTTHTSHNYFIRRPNQVPWSTLHKRIQARATPRVPSCVLGVTEVVSLSALRHSNIYAHGLAMAVTRHLPPDPRLARAGHVVGESNFPGAERPIGQPAADKVRHTHVIGAQGMGKTTYLKNQIIQDMDEGYGMSVVDPHGDLIDDLLDEVPPDRIKDVRLIDFDDPDFVIPMNVLEGKPYEVTEQIMSVLDGLIGLGNLHQTSDILRNAVLTVAMAGEPFSSVFSLMEPGTAGDIFRDDLVAQVKDPMIRSFWRTFDAVTPKERAYQVYPVLRRLRPFFQYPVLRAMLGQTENTLSLDTAINERAIVLINLKGLGKEQGTMFGALFMVRFLAAVYARGKLPPQERHPFFLYVDEFSRFAHLTGFDRLLSEARKFGVGFTLAHQNLGQILRSDVREAVMSEAVNKVIFKLGHADAMMFSRELPPLKPEDLQLLDKREAIVRLVSNEAITSPVTVNMMGPRPSRGSRAEVVASSRRLYAMPLDEALKSHERRQRTTYEEPKAAVIGRVSGDEDLT